jgi:hypothetical protein
MGTTFIPHPLSSHQPFLRSSKSVFRKCVNWKLYVNKFFLRILTIQKMGFLNKFNWQKSSLKKKNNKKKESKKVLTFSSSKTWHEVQSIQLPILIRILANISLAWEIGMYLVTAMNFLLVTYGCFFTFYNDRVWFAVFITDILYGADIIMRLGVEIWRHRYHNKVLVFTCMFLYII